MTPRQIEIVQSSFEKVAPIADTAASLFYGRLFELDPTLRRLFRGDMKGQGAMLMSMIGNAVRGLGAPESLLPVLHSLGSRHAKYGVMDAHYDTVAEALLWTLQQGLGDEFDRDARDAWASAYALMATVMQAGAREARAPQMRAA